MQCSVTNQTHHEHYRSRLVVVHDDHGARKRSKVCSLITSFTIVAEAEAILLTVKRRQQHITRDFELQEYIDSGPYQRGSIADTHCGKSSKLGQGAHHARHVDILEHLCSLRSLPRRTLSIYLGSAQIQSMGYRSHCKRHGDSFLAPEQQLLSTTVNWDCGDKKRVEQTGEAFGDDFQSPMVDLEHN